MKKGENLLPCPFCGDHSIYVEREGTQRASCIVFCGECGCRVESNEIGYGEQWNRRSEPKKIKTNEQIS